MLGCLVIGAARIAAVWTKWYREAVCQTYSCNQLQQKKKKSSNRVQIKINSTKILEMNWNAEKKTSL